MPLSTSLQEFSQIVDIIYQAAFDPAQWAVVSGKVNAITGSVLSSFYVGNYESLDLPLFFGSGMPANYFDLYLPVSHLNPMVPSLALSKPGDIVVQSHVQPEDEFFRSRFYRAFVEPLGLRDSTSIVCRRSGLRITGFQTNSAATRPPYTPDEIAFLRLLAPHLCRAITISDLFELRQIKSEATEAALDALTAAVFLLDGTGRLLHLNQAAERIVRAGDILTVRDQRLVAVDKQSQTELARGLSEHTDIRRAEPSVALQSTRNGHLGMIATLLPLNPTSSSLAPTRMPARWAVFVQDPSVATPLPGEAFARLHGLTPAEMRVALALAPGHSPVEAAGELGLAMPTIRTHMQRIFAKTGTNRQTDLLRLLLNTMPPVMPSTTPDQD